jgi:hypothetical protein
MRFDSGKGAVPSPAKRGFESVQVRFWRRHQGNRMKILLNYVEITQIKYGYILQERNNRACLLQNIILES